MCRGSLGFGSTSASQLIPLCDQWSTRRTFAHIYSPQRKVDNGGVLLLHKVVLREPLDVQDEVRRESGKVMPLQCWTELLCSLAVKLGENG